jgi:vacuolar-type H+-ATPase subunit H
MNRRILSNATNSSTVAVEAVLRAEGAAEERIRQARRDAGAVVAGARARAEAIKRKADGRISRAHVSQVGAVEAEIARLERTLVPLADIESSDEEHAALTRVIRRLAAELTGQTDDRVA